MLKQNKSKKNNTLTNTQKFYKRKSVPNLYFEEYLPLGEKVIFEDSKYVSELRMKYFCSRTIYQLNYDALKDNLD